MLSNQSRHKRQHHSRRRRRTQNSARRLRQFFLEKLEDRTVFALAGFRRLIRITNRTPITTSNSQARISQFFIAIQELAAIYLRYQGGYDAKGRWYEPSDFQTPGTSTSSRVITLGSRSFTTQSGLSLAVGEFVHIASQSDPSKFMEGTVDGYSGTSLTVNVDTISGEGYIFNDWIINTHKFQF